MRYRDELNKAMLMLAEHPKAIFLGQSVACPGTAMFTTLEGVPIEKRLEMPVAENLQLGMSTGIALAGGLPISIFPRINFLLEATSQLVQHLDKLPLYSDYRPKVIIRTAVATPNPLDPGPQHLGNYTYPLQQMMKTVRVCAFEKSYQILSAYEVAMKSNNSWLMVEYTEMYDT